MSQAVQLPSDTDPDHTPPTGRIYGGILQSERIAQRKAQFMRAGFELFGTIGFQKTTVRVLCKEAKLTDRYFYESFGDMEALLLAVYGSIITELKKDLMTFLEMDIPRERLSKAIHIGISRYLKKVQDPRLARICWLEINNISPDVDCAHHHAVVEFANLFVFVLNKYTSNPLSQAEKNLFGIAAVGSLNQTTVYWMLSNYATPRHTLSNILTLVLDSLINAFPSKINTSPFGAHYS